MKKSLTLLILLSIFSNLDANEIARDYIPGKVYLINGDSIAAKIHLSYSSGNFMKKLYLDNFGHYLDQKNKVRGLDPDHINGFCVTVENTVYTFLSKYKLDKHNHPTNKKYF